MILGLWCLPQWKAENPGVQLEYRTRRWPTLPTSCRCMPACVAVGTEMWIYARKRVCCDRRRHHALLDFA